MSRDIGLLGKKRNINTQQPCSNKSCECWVYWDSYTGTGLLFWAALAQLWRDRGELSNIPFFVSHEPSVSVLNKKSKTKRILSVSFSKCVYICEFSPIEDWLFFLPSLFLDFSMVPDNKELAYVFRREWIWFLILLVICPWTNYLIFLITFSHL